VVGPGSVSDFKSPHLNVISLSRLFSLTTQALHWDRGRPARSDPRQVRGSRKYSTSDVLFALRAHSGRDARGPSEELVWLG
jgi:hypothetical protein